MSEKKKKILKPAAWLFYLVIGIEIIYMISPFALYYYSTYGPGLNFLHASPQTAWLSGFFLPHFVKTSSFILNHYQIFGWTLVVAGFIFFLVGAGQIYYHKFAKKGAVTGGIYKYIRHPQYTAFAVMGLGLLLAWPRFTVLIMYVTMLFAYFFLAKQEEKECEQKFSERYRDYIARTSRFIPGDSALSARLPNLPKSRFGKAATLLTLYLTVLTASVGIAFVLRDHSISKMSTLYSENAATISTAVMQENEIAQVLQIALHHPEVDRRIRQATNGGTTHFLNYVVPADWYLPDVPLEKIPESMHGHHQPGNYDRDRYKVLITRAKTVTNASVHGSEIIKKAHGREPVVRVSVDKSRGEVTAIETPPEHVRWGDIPTPLF